MTHATTQTLDGATAPQTSRTLGAAIRQHGLGSPATWARDFALIGGVSGLLGPLLGGSGMLPLVYIATCGVAGAVLGLGVGWLTRWLMTEVLTDVPVLVLLATLGPIVGLFWGAAVGAIGGATLGGEFVTLSVVFASMSAVAQFSWIWLPYTVLRSQGRVTWPLVALAALTPPIGAAFLHVGF